MSGYADKSCYPDEARTENAFIDKPFQPETLRCAKIREILDQQVESRRSA